MNGLYSGLRPLGPQLRRHPRSIRGNISPCWIPRHLNPVDCRRGLLTAAAADPAAMLASIPANLIVSAHSLGLPWLLCLPASALVIRSVAIYPWFVRARRKNLAKLALLLPLVDASLSARTLRQAWSRKSKGSGVRQTPSKWGRRLGVQSYQNKVFKQLRKEYGIRERPWISRIVPVLVLLTVSEAVRRLCGAKGSLLSILLGPVQPYVQPVLEFVQKLVSRSSSFPVLNEADDENTGANVDPEDSASTDWAQASLKTAGPAWCEDLTAPDPWKILPAAFSSLFFATIWFSPEANAEQKIWEENKSAPEADQSKQKRSRSLLQKLYLGFAAFSFIPACSMPSALVIYFASNIVIGRIQAARAMKLFPIIPPPRACLRAPRMQSFSQADFIVGKSKN